MKACQNSIKYLEKTISNKRFVAEDYFVDQEFILIYSYNEAG
jgi:hypothetical protein